MPKMIGNDIPEAVQLEDNATEVSTMLVRLTYQQAIKLKPTDIYKSLDTTDSGSINIYAKRWYRWFASADVIEKCPHSTPNMLERARREISA